MHLIIWWTLAGGRLPGWCASSGAATFVNRSPRMVELFGSLPHERTPRQSQTDIALVGAAEKVALQTTAGRRYAWREYGTHRVMERVTVGCAGGIYAFDGEVQTAEATDVFGRSSMDAARLHFWAVRNGASLPKMSIKMLGTLEGVGVTVSQDVAKSEDIALIPSKLMITTTLVGATKSGALVRAACRRNGKDWRFGALALFLLEERAKLRSFWRPYIAMFPRSVDHLAAGWDASIAAYLQASPSRKVSS